MPTSEQLEACLEERSALLARPAGCRHLSAGRPSQLPIGLVSRALDSATSGIVIADARPELVGHKRQRGASELSSSSGTEPHCKSAARDPVMNRLDAQGGFRQPA